MGRFLQRKIVLPLMAVALVLIPGVRFAPSWTYDYQVQEGSERAAAVVAAGASATSTMSNFELGQYYFNHDDDSAEQYDLKKARQYFEVALREDLKGNPLTWYQLGRIDFIEGKFDTALYKFDKQIEYFGDQVPNVYYMIGLTYGYKARRGGNEKDWQKAEEAFLKFIDLHGMSWASRVDLSWIYFAQGKYQQMRPLLEDALPHYPNNPWLHNMYGLALLNTEEQVAAHEQFLKAKVDADELGVEDWGKSYPGNNPDSWGQGLAEFKAAIEKNIQLTEPTAAGE